MTHVFVLLKSWDYEGSYLVGVCSTMAAAKKLGNEEQGKKLKWVGDRKEAHVRLGRGECYEITKQRIFTIRDSTLRKAS